MCIIKHYQINHSNYKLITPKLDCYDTITCYNCTMYVAMSTLLKITGSVIDTRRHIHSQLWHRESQAVFYNLRLASIWFIKKYIRCLIPKSHTVSKPWDLGLELSNCSDIWQVSQQQCSKAPVKFHSDRMISTLKVMSRRCSLGVEIYFFSELFDHELNSALWVL